MLQRISVSIASVILATGVACMCPGIAMGAGPQSAGNAQPSVVIAKRLVIFVLTGQSNSLGTTADPGEKDISPGEDPLDITIPFFWRNRSTRAGDGPSVLYGDSGGRICGLRAQQGEGANPLFWGPEIGFGRRLAAAGVTNIMIIKASRGGGGNSHWLKHGEMYGHVLETVRQAISALPQDVAFDIAALLYIQGESDSAAEAQVSGERLRLLAQNLRKDLPHAEHMKVLAGGIAAAGAKCDIVRQQQSGLAASDSTFRYIDTLDLRPQLYDRLHFNKSAKLQVGRRMADAWLGKGDLPANVK
ncbi:MAG: sialate O-acetylesterase [Kiritimatiellia bacterium]